MLYPHTCTQLAQHTDLVHCNNNKPSGCSAFASWLAMYHVPINTARIRYPGDGNRALKNTQHHDDPRAPLQYLGLLQLRQAKNRDITLNRLVSSRKVGEGAGWRRAVGCTVVQVWPESLSDRHGGSCVRA